MDKSSKKSTKWIVIGSIVFVLAILCAVGPILFSKYMRAKWERTPSYKVSNVMMTVVGTIQLSKDNLFYLFGDNKQYYVLEDLKESLNDKVGEKCVVQAKMRMPENNEQVDGHPVRLFLTPVKIKFDNAIVNNTEEVNTDANSVQNIKEKMLEKAKLRLKVNTELNKPILFDVIKGTVSSVNRQTSDKKDYVAFVLKDKFSDSYALYKKGADLSVLNNKEVICLGREIIPPSNLPLVVDETTFEIYECYDSQYNKLF